MPLAAKPDDQGLQDDRKEPMRRMGVLVPLTPKKV